MDAGLSHGDLAADAKAHSKSEMEQSLRETIGHLLTADDQAPHAHGEVQKNINLPLQLAKRVYESLLTRASSSESFSVETTAEGAKQRVRAWHNLQKSPPAVSVVAVLAETARHQTTRCGLQFILDHIKHQLFAYYQSAFEAGSTSTRSPTSSQPGQDGSNVDVLMGKRISASLCVSLPLSDTFKNIVLPFAEANADLAKRLKFQSLFVGGSSPPEETTLSLIKAFEIVAQAKSPPLREDAKDTARKNLEGTLQAAFSGLIAAGYRGFTEHCSLNASVDRILTEQTQVEITRSLLKLDFKDLILNKLYLFSALEQVATAKPKLTSMTLEVALSCLNGLSSFAFGVLGPRIGSDFKANMTKLVTNISTLSHGAQAYPGGFIAIIEQVIVATLQQEFVKPTQLRLSRSLSMDATSCMPVPAAALLKLGQIQLANPARVFLYQQIFSGLSMLADTGVMTISKTPKELAALHSTFAIHAIAKQSKSATEVCKNFLKGECSRGDQCPRAHPAGEEGSVPSKRAPKATPRKPRDRSPPRRRGRSPPRGPTRRRSGKRSRSRSRSPPRRGRSRSRSPPRRPQGNPRPSAPKKEPNGGSGRLTALDLQRLYDRYIHSNGGHSPVCALFDLAECRRAHCNNKHEHSKMSARKYDTHRHTLCDLPVVMAKIITHTPDVVCAACLGNQISQQSAFPQQARDRHLHGARKTARPRSNPGRYQEADVSISYNWLDVK
jgi:hypothetical protein